MKKKLVLIVLLFLANSFTLLAQINKTDTTASKKDPAKASVSQTQPDTTASAKAKNTDKQNTKVSDKALKQATQKKQADSLASVKAAKLAFQKKQADSIASVKAAKISFEKNKKDSIISAPNFKLAADKVKKDSLITAKNPNPIAQKSTLDSVITSAKIVSPPIQKTKTDSSTNLKGLPQVVQKNTVDTSKSASIISNNIKPDTTHTVKNLPLMAGNTNKADSIKASKKTLSKKELAKLAKANQTDSLSTKVKPLKAKSSKELKREAKKNDINNLSEKDIIKMAFQHIGSDSSIRNSTIKRADISFTNARPLPLAEPDIRAIKFFHRYWRDIEIQDVKNKKFAQYHADLITALLAAIKNKEINAYSPIASVPENPSGDAFTTTIPYDQLMSGLSDTSVVNILDKDGNITGTKTVPNPFTPDKISGYRIKEDVFYDKTRSRSITRIIGIAPLIKLTLSSGEVISIQPLCWLKYKDCRKILVTIDVDPTKKIGDSMDDTFLQRRFYGRIVQESNPDGRRIKDYKTELPDQIAEAQLMEKKVITFKKGPWNYIMLTEAPLPSPNDNKPIVKTKKIKAGTVAQKQ